MSFSQSIGLFALNLAVGKAFGCTLGSELVDLVLPYISFGLHAILGHYILSKIKTGIVIRPVLDKNLQ